MAKKYRVKINSKGLAEALRTERVGAVLIDAAQAVATSIRGEGIKVGDVDGGKHEIALPVEVRGPGVSRPRSVGGVQGFARVAQATVSLDHPAGEAVQAKHGSLTRAAAQAGLRVTGGDR